MIESGNSRVKSPSASQPDEDREEKDAETALIVATELFLAVIRSQNALEAPDPNHKVLLSSLQMILECVPRPG